jgi:retron-type reverse transcriptase
LAGRRDKNNISPQGNRAGAQTIWGIIMKKEYDFSKAKRGAIEKLSPGKTRITIRLDNEIDPGVVSR